MGKLLPLFREWERGVGDLLWDFRHTVFVVAVVLGLCIVAQAAMGSGIFSRDQLTDSRSNILGAVTAVFIHWDLSALWANAAVLLFFTALLVFSNIPENRVERVRRGRWFAALVLPIAVIVNVVYVLLSPVPTLGASGLVYAGIGITFAFLLLNALEAANKLYSPSPSDRGEPGGRGVRVLALYWLAVNGLFFGILLYLAVLGQSLLFGVGDPGVNAFAHLLGFLVGFVATLSWNYISKSKITMAG